MLKLELRGPRVKKGLGTSALQAKIIAAFRKHITEEMCRHVIMRYQRRLEKCLEKGGEHIEASNYKMFFFCETFILVSQKLEVYSKKIAQTREF